MGVEKAHTHSHWHFCYRDASAFAGLQPAIAVILQHYKGHLLLQGGILGSDSPSTALQATVLRWYSKLSPRAHCAQESSPKLHRHSRHFQPRCGTSATQGTARGHQAQPHEGAKHCCITAALAGQDRGTSSPRGRCQIRSAFQPTSLLAWASSKDTHTAVWTLPARLCFGLQARIGIALAVPTSSIPVSQQDINIFKKPRL